MLEKMKERKKECDKAKKKKNQQMMKERKKEREKERKKTKQTILKGKEQTIKQKTNTG